MDASIVNDHVRPLSASIAATLHAARLAREFSASALAERSGVSRAMIGKIRRDEAQPSAVPMTDQNPPSAAMRELSAAPSAFLATVMRRGDTPNVESLVGFEFRGINTARVMALAGMGTFMKGFERRPDGRCRGYNLRVEQHGPGGAWRALPHDDRPERFAFFDVRHVDATARDNHYLQALLLDYGEEARNRWDPAAVIRDYLVRVRPGSDDLLLGRAFVAAGALRIPVTWFVLERHRRAPPPA